MLNYEKLYHLLFNAITDALEKMESGELGQHRKDTDPRPR